LDAVDEASQALNTTEVSGEIVTPSFGE